MFKLKNSVFVPLGRAGHKVKSFLRGFTLIELILVVSIVLILSAIGAFNYTKSKDKAIAKEAISNLKLIAAAERIYRMEVGYYVNCADTGICNDTLRLMLNSTNWGYKASEGPNAIKLQATRPGSTYTLCSSNFDATPNKGSSCP